MINFYYESGVEAIEEDAIVQWIEVVLVSENKSLGELSFILCDDTYLLGINQKFLNHDTYTDIISFDNTIGNCIGGDIFISEERVRENAATYKVEFEEELRRVLIHGVLHFCGYKDKTDEEKEEMRSKENEKLELFHVEQ
ncbi:rRNA maturation RNase YbeY [Aquimarina pacifica]|uniref:rRNA maturation RNase YbeY n=1 Tax=Aquimarina pacifica TaxID=1296415 RepID=UPI000471AD89|nr:rRNA maturation RNase YbeY [Aquimarina pacifica]